MASNLCNGLGREIHVILRFSLFNYVILLGLPSDLKSAHYMYWHDNLGFSVMLGN